LVQVLVQEIFLAHSQRNEGAMQATVPAVTLILAAVLCVGTNAGKADHPVGKVVALLRGMRDKSVIEMQAEEAEWVKQSYWCKTNLASSKKVVAADKEKIAGFELKKRGQGLNLEGTENEIAQLGKQIFGYETSQASAQQQRDNDNKLYQENVQGLKNALEGIDVASKEVVASTHDSSKKKKQSLDLLDASKSKNPVLTALLLAADPKPDVQAKGAHDAHVQDYKSKTGTTIALLKKLASDFEDKKTKADREETNSFNNFALSSAARDNAKKAAKLALAGAEAAKAVAKKALFEAVNSLEKTNGDLELDAKSGADTKTLCTTKEGEEQSRIKTRTGELNAIDAAVAALSKATGLRFETPNNPKANTAAKAEAKDLGFLQADYANDIFDPKMKAVALIREAGKEAHSKALERLAQEVESHVSGPIGGLNAMIQNMIWRLKKEQTEEDTHKLWGDKELEKSTVFKTTQEDKIEDLKASVEVEQFTVQTVRTEIQEATKAIGDLTAAMAEETEIRSAGKVENALAIKDAESAQNAIAKAVAVLQTVFQESGEAMVQLPKESAAKPAQKPAVKHAMIQLTQSGSEVMALLNTVAADFAIMRSQTSSQEVMDQQDFVTSMNTKKIVKARRTKEVEVKGVEITRRSEKIRALTKSVKVTEGQLWTTNQYLKDLAPACKDGDSSYADRKAARKRESESLQKAKGILAAAAAVPGPRSFLQKPAH